MKAKQENQIPQLSEADVKKAVLDRLQYGENQGDWIFMRLNAGSFILTDSEGKFRRRVKGAKKGTADFIVIQPANARTYHNGQFLGEPHPIARVTFIETKRSKGGKQTKEQVEFEGTVKAMHCHYFVVRDADELKTILEG